MTNTVSETQLLVRISTLRKVRKLERDTDMPVRMTSEKFIRAERKNRLEVHYLNVTCKHFDKQTVRLNYEIDREKRHITKQFRNVVKTSGASDLGMPPKNEKDTSYEKCQSYRQGLKLTNKRLFEWREVEKQLNKFINNHEAEQVRGKRKRVSSAKKSKDNMVVYDNDKDDEHDDVFDDIDTVSTANTIKVSPIDVVKENTDDNEEVFDVKKWEKEMMESYKNMICTNISGKGSKYDSDNKSRSRSSPSYSTNPQSGDEPSRVRPHTAHERPRIRPPSARSLPPRPMSAHVKPIDNTSKFLITKDSIYMKSGQKFEKLMDSRPVDSPVLVNNYLDVDSLMPPGSYTDNDTASVSMGSVNGLCTVQEGNEDDDSDGASTVANGVANGVSNGIEIRLQHPSINLEARSDISSQSNGLKSFTKRKPGPKRTQSSSAISVASVSTQRSNFKHSNSDLSSYVEGNRRRRRDSGSTSCSVFSRAMSRTGSTVSSLRPSVSLGIPSDIDEISRGQDKLAAEISAEKPLAPNKLVSVAKVVKCAMTFSRVARARALQQMQEENSADSHEIIRQERLRLLQSRQNVLNSIASQWQSNEDPENPVIEQVE